jgi:ethanolamine utilization cobalamin adenosyltransferase
MRVITEAYLRSVFRKDAFKTFAKGQDQILTPLAAQFLSERSIRIVKPEEGGQPVNSKTGARQDGQDGKRPAPSTAAYVSAIDGSLFETKPEHMTHLKGNRLVSKDHPRICFRGGLDLLQSDILMVQAEAAETRRERLTIELGQILKHVRQIMKADVLDQPLDEADLLGLTQDELRAHSHNPKEYYGIGHITPDAEMGRTLLSLNLLRSRVRQVELSAVAAFQTEFEIQRMDIIQCLNRMSSAFYIMMIRERAGRYTN